MKYIFLALLISLSMGFAKSSAEGQEAGSPNGRYAFVISPINRADQYLIDSKTGKVWRMAHINGSANEADTALDPQLFMCGEGKYSLTPKCDSPFPYRPNVSEPK